VGQRYTSWGNYPAAEHIAFTPQWREKPWFPDIDVSILPRGNGRSYGDSCLNDQGALLDTTALDRFINFNRDTGVLSCEAGVQLCDILRLVEPHGWFLPVTPGTQFVTVAGAIANDVHGKNHHLRGCFSHHVLALQLERSDGESLCCTPHENTEWFRATVGGLGLTGFISRATLQLMHVDSPFVATETFKTQNLSEFFERNEASQAFEYTVAWIDCLARSAKRGRGHYIRGNHTNAPANPPSRQRKRQPTIPLTPPISAINPLSLRLFNSLYYHRQRETLSHATQARDPFFYPLDGIRHWNRLYGRRGFLQYQCVIPPAVAPEAIDELLDKIARSRAGSFLVVLKAFGDIPSRGMLSFARPGVTLAMDFPYLGPKTLALLDDLDTTTFAAGGALYPAKDARMSAEHFQQGYPEWATFARYKDPAISSGFWRRVTGDS
jgi:FAD/FMN-containing dehydrogenase